MDKTSNLSVKFKLDDLVKIHGLQNNTDLNGKLGVINKLITIPNSNIIAYNIRIIESGVVKPYTTKVNHDNLIKISSTDCLKYKNVKALKRSGVRLLLHARD